MPGIKQLSLRFRVQWLLFPPLQTYCPDVHRLALPYFFQFLGLLLAGWYILGFQLCWCWNYRYLSFNRTSHFLLSLLSAILSSLYSFLSMYPGYLPNCFTITVFPSVSITFTGHIHLFSLLYLTSLHIVFIPCSLTSSQSAVSFLPHAHHSSFMNCSQILFLFWLQSCVTNTYFNWDDWSSFQTLVHSESTLPFSSQTFPSITFTFLQLSNLSWSILPIFSHVLLFNSKSLLVVHILISSSLWENM